MPKKAEVNKLLDRYLNLNFKTEIKAIPDEKGGGFEASIPQLGRYAFIGQGDTPIEALKDLQETKKEYFEEFIEQGIKIPDTEEERKEFRGYRKKLSRLIERLGELPINELKSMSIGAKIKEETDSICREYEMKARKTSLKRVWEAKGEGDKKNLALLVDISIENLKELGNFRVLSPYYRIIREADEISYTEDEVLKKLGW